MDGAELLLAAVELLARELALFAGAGFLLLGLSDLAVDLIWICHSVARRLHWVKPPVDPEDLLLPSVKPGRMAVFVPAWHEAAVIGDMLRHALERFEHDNYRIYVGCYPNDGGTIDAVRGVRDSRIRLVVGTSPGPTTKADCLNRLWEALLADEAAEGMRAKAVVLHDAEDIVHSAELKVFDSLIGHFDLVQLPVLPLIDANSRWIAGHYVDEFAESHGKELVVRQALGAGLPSAGVGCAFSRSALHMLADQSEGLPFDADSLTEDYELGLRLHVAGGRSALVRLSTDGGKRAVVTREYFPATLDAAVSQKSRWMTGIALSGWDRLGWGSGLAERWMRLRDRQSVLAAILLFAGYMALLLWALLGIAQLLGREPTIRITEPFATLLQINAALLVWRLGMRFAFVTRAHGWREGLRSIPRVVVSNAIAMIAARKAVFGYLATRRTGEVSWNKTAHAFPIQIPAE